MKASKLKVGDTVMIIAGGSKGTRDLKGKTGRILNFAGGDRVVVQGLNHVYKHKRASSPQDEAGKITFEAPVHISNVMYYSEQLKRPVRLGCEIQEDGKKLRGFRNPEDGKFVGIE